MRKIFLLLLFVTATLLNAKMIEHDKVFVVERENSALAVIDHHLLTNEIKNLHNFNHAIVKFEGKDGYIITRDGYIIKFDPIKEVKEKEYKVSKSSIDFAVSKNFIAVANYDNKTVMILSRDLKPIQTIKTGSRNVGIHLYKKYLIFECMDKDEIWIMKNGKMEKQTPHFKLYKKITNIGKVPFDAMRYKNSYIAVLFNSPFIGVLNLDTMQYKKVPLDLGTKDRVLKVPHIGLWSVSNKYFFIPAVGSKNVAVFDLKFNHIKNINVVGNPVFTSLSPNKKYLAVTFSGKDFPRVQIIDAKTFKIIKNFKFDGMVLHVRWSSNGKYLYISDNGGNKVFAYNVNGWWKNFMFPVPHSSGIFIYHQYLEK